MNPVILHIPHASTIIPLEEMDLYAVSEDFLRDENLRLADLHTDSLYDLPGAARAVFELSRFCVDVERFSDDTQESMAARGMGALYTCGTDLAPIRPHIPSDRRTRLLHQYYWPHHNRLDTLAQERLDAFGGCLVIDCHSYPSKPLPYELENRALPRPEIGIGTDLFHTPPELLKVMETCFQDRGYEIAVDTPFSGALVPNRFYSRDKRVASIMVEVRKDLYMDEISGVPNDNFNKIRKDLTEIMTAVSASFEKNL